jgi:tetratricopeptide (TPR) repeat protein
MRALRAAMARNEVRAPPRGTRVQSRLRAVLVRGLRALPDERFPSMAALVAELRRRARPRVRPAAVVAALAFLVGAGALTASLVARDRRCAGVAREAASAWGAAESARVHDAFARAKLPFFDAVWATTSSLLDGYARELGRRRVEVCAATELRREQPEPVRQLRDACLRDRQRELVSLVDLFAAADAATVERAPQIASALPSFEPCDDVETLRSETRSPRSRQEGLKAAALRQRLDAAWARQQVGHDQGLGDELATIASEAKALDYAPIEGAALYRLAMWKSHVGDLKAAQPLFEAAATRALAANNDVEAELSWSELARLFAAGLGKPKEAELWLGFADAAEKRRRGHDGYTVDTINTRAQLEIAEGKLGDAEKSWERAIALIDELHMSPILRVEYEGNRAIAQARQWRLDAAEPTFRHVLEEHRRLFGDDHPDTVTARENMVQLLNLMGRFAEALPLAERGLAERLATQGANGGDLPDAQHNLAESLVGLGRAQEGLGHSRAALAILTPRVGADSPALADYLVPEGEALVRLGQRAAGLRLLEAALAKHEAAHDEGIDLAPTELALARAIVSGAHSSTATARAIALATAARAAHLEAAARWGGNNQARADEIAAFIRSASATGPRD